MNNNYEFNQLFNLENETAPEATSEKRELTTFQKVVMVSAGVGVIAGAALITMKTADHAVDEVKGGVEGFKRARAKSNDEKNSKKAAEMAAFKKSLIDQGWTEEAALEACLATYGKK